MNTRVSLAHLKRMTRKLDKAEGVSVDFMHQLKEVQKPHPEYKGDVPHYEN